MSWSVPPYLAAMQLAEALAHLVPASAGGKLARTFSQRAASLAHLEAWGESARRAEAPLLWMHAASVGEGLQARPVLELAAAEMPELLRAFTWFSPSAEPFARGVPADVTAALPFDTRHNAHRLLAALRPSALVFTKADVWPVLVQEASARRVPIGLVSAQLGADSRRAGGLWSLLRSAYASLDRVGAITADDAERLVAAGVRPTAISVTGDTRYDQVAQRAERVTRDHPVVAPLLDGRPTLVAGSTWPADERVLLPAWSRLRADVPTARLIIAPHELGAPHLAAIEGWASAAALSCGRIGSAGAAAADVVLVDRMGVLGDLYALANAAFVGGGFHAAGLHSVLEPAAFGAPVLFGPQHSRSRDALRLLEAGGGAAEGDVSSVARRLTHWLADGAAEGRTVGQRARAVVESERGATVRSWALVRALLARVAV